MGKFEIQQPALLGAQTSTLASSAADIAAWLDELLTILGAEAIAPWRAAEIRSRLKDTSLDAILSAIERARPGLGDSVETTLYQQWIEANPASPLLWAAWFNIAIVLARHQGVSARKLTLCRHIWRARSISGAPIAVLAHFQTSQSSRSHDSDRSPRQRQCPHSALRNSPGLPPAAPS